MNKIVFSFVCAVLFMGCTNVYVTAPDVDADVVLPPDASVDALMLPDSSVPADAGADAAPDTSVPDVCGADSDCCANGQPIRVGSACGGYPAGAEAVCNTVGVCTPRVEQTCTDVNACCDGWAPRIGSANTPCHCVVDYERDHPVTNAMPYLRGCTNEPNEGQGNMQGICRYEYAGSFNGHQQQFTCVSHVIWTP